MGVLTEGKDASVGSATHANLDSWIATAEVPFTYVLDSVDPEMEYYFSLQRDSYLIIDLSTMKLLETVDGSVSTALAHFSARLP